MKKRTCLILILVVVSVLIPIAFLTIKAPQEETPPVRQGEIRLPEPRYSGDKSVEGAILNRRSVRDYRNEFLSLEEISQLLWSAQGITDGRSKRAAPSAGALYPLEIYVVVGLVEGLNPGVYHYQPEENSLVNTLSGDLRKELAQAALNQAWVENAPVDVVITAVYGRTTRKYGERGIRYVWLEAGHAAQNICLQVESLGLGTVTVGAFDDSRVKEILNLTDEEPLYIMPVGRI